MTEATTPMETTEHMQDPTSASDKYAYHYPSADGRCRGWVIDWRRKLDHQCQRHATTTEDGKPYCQRHTPDRLAARVRYFLSRRRRAEAAALCSRYGRYLSDVVHEGTTSGPAITKTQLAALERLAADAGPQAPQQALLIESALGLLRKNLAQPWRVLLEVSPDDTGDEDVAA